MYKSFLGAVKHSQTIVVVEFRLILAILFVLLGILCELFNIEIASEQNRRNFVLGMVALRYYKYKDSRF